MIYCIIAFKAQMCVSASTITETKGDNTIFIYMYIYFCFKSSIVAIHKIQIGFDGIDVSSNLQIL